MRSLPRLCAAVLLAAPAGAWALGLGDIQLQSALNQPFRAEIALLSASADELQSVKVGLASPETFSRYGLDRPADLSSLRFKITKNAAGKNVILVTSQQRIDDPFVTMLVEATWARGRLLREYTVLLDPPVLLPGRAEQAPIRQAQTAAPQPAPAAEGAIARPPAATVQAAQAASSASAPAAQSGSATANSGADESAAANGAGASAAAASSPGAASSYGPVRRAETLWDIASNLRPSDVTTNQMMVALYEANPDAFEHNMNVLLRGATLTVPGRNRLTAMSAAEATAEVKRQAASWQSSAPAAKALAQSESAPESAAPEEQARLRLLPPKADAATAANGTGSGSGANAAGAEGQGGAAGGAASGSASQAEVAGLRKQVASLQSQLEQNQRLLQLRDQQLQALQDQIAQRQAGGAPAPAKPASSTAAPGVALESEQLFTDDAGKKAAAAGQPASSSPVDNAAKPAAEAAAKAGAGQAAASEPQPSPAAAPTHDASPQAQPPAAQAQSAAASGNGAQTKKAVGPSPAVPSIPAPSLLSRVLGWIANPILLIGLGIGAVLLTAVWYLRYRREEADDVTGRWDALEAEIEEESRSASARFKRPSLDGVVVEEQGALAHADDEHFFGESAGAESAETDDETLSTQTVINLDQADPVAEADFHMAYGLYDQAADLVSKALEAEPLRRDLKLKLLEVYFVWGNKDAFLQTARELRADIGDAASGDWDKVLIMGKQICPDEPLFAESAAADSVDVDLQDDGSTELDFALGETSVGDIDFGTGTDTHDDLGFELAATGELLAQADANAEDDDDREDGLADFGSDLDSALGPDFDSELNAELDSGFDSGLDSDFDSELDIGAQTAAGLEAALFTDDDGKDAASATTPSDEFDALAVTQESPTAEHRRDDDEDWASLLDDVAASDDEDEDEDEDIGSQAPTVETPTVESSLPGVDLPAAEAFGAESPTIETPTVETPYAGHASELEFETSRSDAPTVETPYLGAHASSIDMPRLDADDEYGFGETDTGLDPEAIETLTGEDEEADTSAPFDFAESAESGIATAEHTEEIDLDDLGLSLGDLEDLPDDIGELPSGDEGEEDTREQRVLAADDALLEATGVTEVLQEDDLENEIELRAEAREGEPLAEARESDLLQTDVSEWELSEHDPALAGLAQAGLPESDFEVADLDVRETSVLADHEATQTSSFDDGTFVGTEVLEQRHEADNSGDTSLLKSLGLNADGDGLDGGLDLNLEDLSAALEEGDTVEQQRSSAFEDFFGGTGHTPIDLDIGIDLPAEDDPTGNASFGPLDPQTMTEIGTKIDLARAYIDMGDPDGARSILEEVLDEGDSTQRREAQDLIDAMSA